MLTRALIALCTFALCLGTSFWFIYSKKRPLPSSRRLQEFGQQSKEDTIFYRTIGHVPQSTKSEEASELEGKLPSAQFTLELAMTETEAEARQILARLSAKGIQAYYTPLQNNGRVIYRVRQGVYASRGMASQAGEALLRRSSLESRVTKLR